MSALAHYQAYGLTIASDLALPLPRAAGREPDLVLHRAGVADLSDAPLDRDEPGIIATYERPQDRWYVAFTADDGYRMRFRNCGEFIVAGDFSTVRWIAVDGGRDELLPILFAGTVLAFILTMQGHLVLHASAVSRGGNGLAFVGQSGRGKSTLAALTAAAGARIVTDDVLLVDVDGAPRCRGNAGELRLRDGARGLVTTFGGRVEPRETADHRLALLTEDAERDWLGLRAIAVPRPSREATEVAMRRLPAGEAVTWLLRFPRVHGLRPPDILRRQLELLGALVRSVPVYDVTVPWGPPFLPRIGEDLLRLLAPDVGVGPELQPAREIKP